MVGLRYLILWLLLFMGSTTVFSTRYQKVFGSDWTSAARYVADHHAEWQQEFAPFGVDARLAEAIVFPELIRYSMWQDEIEPPLMAFMLPKAVRVPTSLLVGSR